MMHNLLPFAGWLCLALAATLVQGSTENERKPYIVYMGEAPHHEPRISVMDKHHNLLLKAVGDENIARESKIYSYGKSINAFAARLLPDEAKRLSGVDGVISVFENTRRKLLTTRSWDFLGMHEKLKKRNAIAESNIIVGVLDTGIWPKSPSFNDKGYGPPPAKWKGKCDKGANFTGCNNKVIGARYYQLDNTYPIMEDPTPVDTDGHGTHTASTAAGIAVKDSSLYGIAKGTARGGVPSARIAMYKVCWISGCSDMDLLAAYDDAIHDGVDLISISIGGPPKEFFHDPIAIGAFHAMRKGILTSCAGGNEGPMLATVQNVAPWIMTVAASSIDRQFTSKIKLGDGTTTSGNGINTFSMKNKMYPFTNGAHATNLTGNYTDRNISACDYGALSQDRVKGKIVYCLGEAGQDYTIQLLGGAGTIMATDAPQDYYFLTLTPAATVVRSKDGDKLDRYINSTKKPQAVIYKSRTVKMNAPFVASFSSRGPQLLNRNILKPDIAAPGLNILAAYTNLRSITGEPSDKRYSAFNFMSGTSMACPHASAAAAYVKSMHPDWSPAAIKSALMTTATPMKIRDKFGELSSGSGQINPIRAIQAGLIYDIDDRSYISFLCKEGYNSTTIGLLIGGEQKLDCSSFKPARGTDGLNYPSMHVHLNSTESRIFAVFYRTVTHVAYGYSEFKAKVTSPKGLSITVIPNTLKFNRTHQKQSFKVLVKGGLMKNGTEILSATLEWSNKEHSVKSPILVYK
ncbi:PREDICTED: subtilisin-like protease SBT4.15 [Theobroma cacao]|uniref:Subtilisin-like protease SBT4.15 n=1 Tax=Theobroma cacao TaxID=3641 RepID=A0AB32V3Q4_THECC|nr:PREDICTED: subtilisin-like protease SBT4.15 [Theobroma cacao]